MIVVNEDLDMNALRDYRKDIEFDMDTRTAELLKYIQTSSIADYDRIYSQDSIINMIQKVCQRYDLILDNDSIPVIVKWFRGYFDDLRKSYKRDDTFVRSNPHPQGKNVGDCVKRAFVHGTGKDYMEVQRELNRIKRDIGSNKYNDNKVWREFCKRFGLERVNIPAPKRGEARMNGHKFCLDFPEGTYILRMARHLSCCKDGKIYDSWDCRDKAVYQAYRVKGE